MKTILNLPITLKQVCKELPQIPQKKLYMVPSKGISPQRRRQKQNVKKQGRTSKKEAGNLLKRKKEKHSRRLSALDKKTKWSKDKKELVRGLLSSKSAHKYMSSDEERDDGFISHPFLWESESFRSVKDSLDKKFLETCPVRSKRLLFKRTRGSLKEEEPPTLPEQFMWIVSS